MNNHQSELAEKLGEDGFLEHCVCSTLTETIENFNESTKKIFPNGDLEKFKTFIDNLFSTSEGNEIVKTDNEQISKKSYENQSENEESNYLRYVKLDFREVS